MLEEASYNMAALLCVSPPGQSFPQGGAESYCFTALLSMCHLREKQGLCHSLYALPMRAMVKCMQAPRNECMHTCMSKDLHTWENAPSVSMSVCMCTNRYRCMQKPMHTSTKACTEMCRREHVHTQAHAQTCKSAGMCAQTYACIHMHMDMFVHTHTYRAYHHTCKCTLSVTIRK